MAKTAVIVDSSSYIKKEDIDKYGIFVINDPVIFGTDAKLENSWSTQQEFFNDLNNAKVAPTTSLPTPGEITRVFDEVANRGFDSAIIVTISSGLSGTYQSIKNLAEDFAGFKEVLVWDSQIATIAAGDQAIYAAELLKSGFSIKEIEPKLGKLRDSTKVFFVVDSIKHLQRTGRLSGGQALVAGALKIKPILEFKEGKIVAASKARKMEGAWDYIEKNFGEIVSNSKTKIRVNLIDANNAELADQWMEKGKKLWPEVEFVRGIIGPYIAVHTGEKSIGWIWADDFQTLLKSDLELKNK